jgi:uncharacterized phiE125 gp8 family phage protein
MSALLLAPPASEPLSLADAKQFLRVEHGDDDAVITALIAAARAHVEAITRRALMAQTWRFVLDAWLANGRVAPRIGPLRTLSAARVYDTISHANVLDVQGFVVDVSANVIAAPYWALPVPGRSVAGIELDVICGFGAVASDVPKDLLQALKMLVAHWYDNRGVVAAGGNVSMQPAGLCALIAPYRVLSL